MHIITTSSTGAFRACNRKYKHLYVDRYRSKSPSAALRFGSLFHLMLNAWWSGEAIEDVLKIPDAEGVDPFVRVRAQELMSGYDLRWERSTDVVDVEQSFDIQIVNPDTGRPMQKTRLQGKIDVRCTDEIVEHKTTSQDISTGSPYWRRLAIDNQVSNYLIAAGVNKCVYDVISTRLPKPFKETPDDKKRYTASGALDKRQHAKDETPEEYRLRVCETIAKAPDKFYQRGDVVRLPEEIVEAQYDLYQQALMIRNSARTGHWPRNPNACLMYNTECAFFDVCSGISSLEESPKLVRKEKEHEEL